MATTAARQPIFYPVLSEEYAAKIAPRLERPALRRRVRSRNPGPEVVPDQNEVHQVSGKTILYYWMTAEHLPVLNASIVGTIEMTAEYQCPRQQRA